MIDTFANDRDPYATISQFVFHKDYWECMEHHQDGTPNPDGKALRKKAKGVMLGILYGMGAKLMSQVIGVSMDECKEILNEFFKMFPNVKDFTTYNEKMAKEKGYVEDYMGRRRNLPDASLDEIEVIAKKKIVTNADIFIDCNKNDSVIDIPDEEVIKDWTAKWKEYANSKKFNAKKDFKELAKNNGVELYDNGAFISKTMTQCTNARIQGGAATLTKKAMVAIANDELMKKYDFKLLIPVHDELLGECKIEYAEEAQKRLTELMVGAALPECTVKMKCDAYCVKHWYADEVFNQIHDTYIQGIDSGENRDNILNSLFSDYPELSRETIIEMCDDKFDVLTENI